MMSRSIYTSLSLVVFFVALAFLYLQPAVMAWIAPPPLELVSVNSDEEQANAPSYYPAPILSTDGRFALFTSSATNLVENDTNQSGDAFVRDRLTGETRLISQRADGSPPPGFGFASPDGVSDDGTLFLFTHFGNSLLPTVTNTTSNVFLRNEAADTLELISKFENGTATGAAGRPDMSGDGEWVVYTAGVPDIVPTDPDYIYDLFLFHRPTQETTLVSVNAVGVKGNSGTEDVAMTHDGTGIVFTSNATNMVLTDTTPWADIFYKDLTTGAVELISRDYTGTVGGNSSSYAPTITPDGRYVAFWSWASDLVPNDTNFQPDAFLFDRQTGETELISVASNGTQANDPSYYGYPAVSADGRYVAFSSYASNLVPGDDNNEMDVFIRDRLLGQTTRVSIAATGTQGNEWSGGLDMSPDGRYLLFNSYASNLFPTDANNVEDFFFIDREAPEPTPTPTLTPSATPEHTPTATASPTGNPSTPTATVSPTATSVPPTATASPTTTATATGVPPTPTATVTATSAPLTPTATATPTPHVLYLPAVQRESN